MKKLILLLFIGLFSALNSLSQDQEIDSSQDEEKVQGAVVRWADSVFYKHSEYKFEQFHAFYTEEYFIQVMRARMYKERLSDLEKSKKIGRYKKSDAEYKKEHDQMQNAYDKIQVDADNFKFRVSHFEIHFWSNIQTNDGITVYYEHIVQLDNDYRVIDTIINSSIGAKSDKTEITYKKGKGPIKKK